MAHAVATARAAGHRAVAVQLMRHSVRLRSATYTLSTEGLWPWTYSACQPELGRTMAQARRAPPW